MALALGHRNDALVIFAAVVLFLAVNGIGLLRGMAFGDIVMIAISQVVGMIPEGLPVAMTIALAVGVRRMAQRQAPPPGSRRGLT